MKKKKKNEPKQKKQWSVDSFYRLSVFFASCVILVIILIYDRSVSEWSFNMRPGDPASRDVYAPFDMTYVDEEKTSQERQNAAENVHDIYRVDETVTERALNGIDEVFTVLSRIQSGEESVVVSDRVSGALTESVRKSLEAYDSLGEFSVLVKKTVQSINQEGILSFLKKIELLNNNIKTIFVQKGDRLINVEVKDIPSLEEAKDRVFSLSLEYFPRDRRLRKAFVDIVSAFLEPNLIFDKEETKVSRNEAYESVDPVIEEIKSGETILRRGSIVTALDVALLQTIETKVAKEKATLGFVGICVFTLLFVLLLAVFLKTTEPKIYYSIRDIVLVNSVIITTLLLVKIMQVMLPFGVYFLPLMVAPLLLAILCNMRVGIFVSMGMAILGGLMTNYDPLVIFMTLFGSIAGAYATIDLRHRIQFLKVGLYVGVTNFLVIFSFAVLKEMTIKDAFNEAVFGLWNGIFIMPVLYLALIVFESLFDIVTPIRLVELSDLNHPLLKRLILEAPGTYHHSLVVSNLSESACEAIGANSLLARVGAYFHDIGKMAKSEYFTENQLSKEKNLHEKLSPTMSYFIITKHVKDGVELAKKYKLKKVIIDFIQQHHGTGLVYFFYKKAMDKQAESGKVNSSDFRYPGPKPQSKETAITLLADSVEAASRSLQDPTPASIRGLVDNITTKKFLDNQLDECDLTIHDLHKIRESFVRNLMAIYHTRVEYPDMKEEKGE